MCHILLYTWHIGLDIPPIDLPPLMPMKLEHLQFPRDPNLLLLGSILLAKYAEAFKFRPLQFLSYSNLLSKVSMFSRLACHVDKLINTFLCL